MSDTLGDTLYSVTFSGDYFSTTVNLYATDDEGAEALAAELIRTEYGWDIASASHDVKVEEWA